MAVYAVGDVQGCYDELRELLIYVKYQRGKDKLWFVGDLVNRGPKSLEVLRFVAELGTDARVVLGNHDLNLLAIAAGVRKLRPKDTVHDVLDAPDGAELIGWLGEQPLLPSGASTKPSASRARSRKRSPVANARSSSATCTAAIRPVGKTGCLDGADCDSLPMR